MMRRGEGHGGGQSSSPKLQPIYHALDSRNYAKAIKLCSASSAVGDWTIVRALRAHALERSGKVAEGLSSIRELLREAGGEGGGGGRWRELDERIRTLTGGDAAAEGSSSADSGGVGGGGSKAAATGKSGGGGKGGGGGKKGKKGKGGGGSKAHKSAIPPPPPPPPKKDDVPELDLVERLDGVVVVVAHGGGAGRIDSDLLADAGATDAAAIVDETVLATIAATLRSQNLHGTSYEMYRLASDALTSPSSAAATKKQSKFTEEEEEVTSILKETYAASVRLLCEVPPLPPPPYSSSSSKRSIRPEDITSARTLVAVYETMQSTAMQLVKHRSPSSSKSSSSDDSRSQSLYLCWAARAALWNLEASKRLLQLLESESAGKAPSEEEEEQEKKTLRAKTELLLPRLAESLASRALRRAETDGKSKREEEEFPPSGEERNLHLRSLEIQNKHAEMLQALDAAIPDGEGRSIDDEDDVRDNVGSLIRLSDRERLERRASVLTKLRRYEEAAEVYEKLLDVHGSDGWNHWTGLLQCVVRSSLGEEANVVGNDGLDEALGEFERRVSERRGRDERRDGNVPPTRGVRLAEVEAKAVRVRGLLPPSDPPKDGGEEKDESSIVVALREGDDNDDDEGPWIDLKRAVVGYAEAASSNGASCAFDDLRPYVALLCRRRRRTKEGGRGGEGGPTSSSSPPRSLLDWSASHRIANRRARVSSATADDGDGANAGRKTEKERKSRLRSYLTAVKIGFEIASRLDDDDDDDVVRRFLPGVDELMDESRSSSRGEAPDEREAALPPSSSEGKEEGDGDASDAKDNAADGTPKENRPGNELILLAVQRLLFRRPGTSFSSPVPLLLASASLLERASRHCPSDPTLKVALVRIYSSLSCGVRASRHYDSLNVRHVQIESLSYLLLPGLLSSGLYDELVERSGDVLRFHSTSTKDCREYARRAFDRGTIGKACEFVDFAREKMGRRSLSLLEAKGFVMGCAPLVSASSSSSSSDKAGGGSKKKTEKKSSVGGGGGKGDTVVLPPAFGVDHGLTGGDDDVSRASKMIDAIDDARGAPNLLRIAASPPSSSYEDDFGVDARRWSDNRDLDVLSHEILPSPSLSPLKTLREIVRNAKRTGLVQGLLVRSALCVDAARGPKKGKLTKPTDVLRKRTGSLLRCLKAMNAESEQAGDENVEGGEAEASAAMREAMVHLGRTIAIVCGGKGRRDSDGDGDAEREQTEDTLASREARAASSLNLASSAVRRAVVATRRSLPLRRAANETDDDDRAAETLRLLLEAPRVVSTIAGALPSTVAPTYALIETTAKLFSTYGWGKRKRHTKRASEALAETAVSFRGLIAVMVDACKSIPDVRDKKGTERAKELLLSAADDAFAVASASETDGEESGGSVLNDSGDKKTTTTGRLGRLLGVDGDSDDDRPTVLDEVVSSTASSWSVSRERIEPILSRMVKTLDSYDVPPSDG